MDEAHFVTALRYVALNPVRTGLVQRAPDWCWSSTRALIAGQSDHVVKRWSGSAILRHSLLGHEFDEALTYAALRKAESVGRPIGSSAWLADMEAHTGQTLTPQKRGPKPRVAITVQ
jgi:putative transposase